MCLVGGSSNLIGDESGTIESITWKPIICNYQVLPHMVSTRQRDNIHLDQNCKDEEGSAVVVG